MVSSRAFIGEGVTIGDRASIAPGAVIFGPATIGDRVFIGAGSVIGSPPEISDLAQNAAWAGSLEHAGVVIHDDVVIRENVVIHQGSHRPTTVGSGTWLLNRSYLAHDVVVEQNVVISAGVSIGGHCTIGARSNIGMNAVIHQRRVVGPGSMVGMGTPVSRDVPPFATVFGTPPRLRAINAYALDKLGLSRSVSDALLEAYSVGDFRFEDPSRSDVLRPIENYLAWWAERKALSPVRTLLNVDEGDTA